MLHVDELAPRTPHLPGRRLRAVTQFAVSAGLHVVLVAVLLKTIPSPVTTALGALSLAAAQPRPLVVTLELPQPARGGGGGGGNRRPGPIPRAQAIGADTITLRTTRLPPPPAVAIATAAPDAMLVTLPSIVLDAKPLASGRLDVSGLPSAATASGTSRGPGSGGGVGSGTGTGTGSGRGPGLGPGSGGGTGGGVYRPGGAVSTPRLLREVQPRYTVEALRQKIQGTVLLEAVVTRDGCASNIRVIRSLDRGLDAEAVSAVGQWLFEPGRLAGTAVDVLVTIRLDFTIR